jgi:Secretion system C-terminal sorting domain
MKKQFFALVIILVCAVTVVAAQTIRYNKVYNYPSNYNFLSKSIYINDSNYVCISNIYNGVTNHDDKLSFILFDKNGNAKLSKVYQFDTTVVFGPSAVVMMKDSCIYSLNQVKHVSNNDPQLILTKFNIRGDTLWTKYFGKPQAIEVFYQLIETTDKKIVAVGVTAIAADGWSKSHVTLMKIDTNGTVLWQKDYGPNGKHSYGWGVVETPTHGFLISGYKSDGGNAGFPFNYENDFYAIKTDSAGNTIWTKYYGTLHHEDAGLGIIKCKTGGYYLVGQTDTSVALTFYFSRLIQIMKIDESGKVKWKRSFGKYSYDNACRTGFELADGSLVCYGAYLDTTNSQVLHAQLIKVDSNGMEQWHRIYTYPAADINPWALTHCPDGGFLMSGFVNYDIVQPADGWLLKVDSFGCLVGGCEQWDEVIEIETTNNEQLVVYPNPATNQIIISCDDIYTITQLQIIDILGKVVLESKIANLDEPSFNNKATSTKEVTIASINKGIYIVQAIFKNGKSKTVKFVKE